jgi:hypothetical protein
LLTEQLQAFFEPRPANTTVMKPFQFLLAFSTLNSAIGHAYASQSSSGYAPRGVSDFSNVKALAVREEDSCSALDKLIDVIGTSQSAVVYTTVGGVSALAACRLLRRRNPNNPGTDDCYDIATLVAAGIVLVFQLAHDITGGFALRDLDEFDRTSRLRESLAGYLDGNGHVYDSIDVLPTPAKRDDKDRQMLDHISVGGLKFGNDSYNMALAHYGEGDAHLFFTGDSGTDLTKRHDGPGIKLSFTTRLPSKLSKAHQQDMSISISENWANLANRNQIVNWIGLVKTVHKANFYLRIIPEVKGFGTNYESVDICGGMAKYL